MQINYYQKTIDTARLSENIAQISENAKKGISYLVLKNKKPIFCILPYKNNLSKKYLDFFETELKNTGLYKNAFIKKILESEQDILKGNLKNIDEL